MIQRWLCRKCGFRFSKLDLNHKNEVGYTGSCQVCVTETQGAKNLAKVETTRQEVGQREATVTDVKSLLFQYAWYLKKQGCAQSTIEGRVWLLKILAKRGADLCDPESVKEAIARQESWCSKRKANAVDAYSSFLMMTSRTWNPPVYKYASKVPYVPSERELDALIAGCGKRTSTFLQLLKETAVRSGEAKNLLWTDIDFEHGTIRVTPEKGSDPRIFSVSLKLLNMLAALKHRNPLFDQRRVFTNNLRTIRKIFEKQRANIAKKLQNPRLTQIHFHTFRHWKATILYHQTKDILYVMRFLGHRNIKNTLVYIQIEEAMFSRRAEEYVCKVAETVNEARILIETGFQYVCDFNGAKMFRKPKTLDLEEGTNSGAGVSKSGAGGI